MGHRWFEASGAKAPHLVGFMSYLKVRPTNPDGSSPDLKIGANGENWGVRANDRGAEIGGE